MNERTARDVVLVRAIETADAAAKSGATPIACGPGAWRRKSSATAQRTTRSSVAARRLPSSASRATSGVQRAAARSTPSRAGSLRSRRRRVRRRRCRRRHRARASDQPARAAGAGAARLESRGLRRAARRALAPQRRSRPDRRRDRCGDAIIAALRDVRRVRCEVGRAAPLAAALGRFAADWTALATPLWQQRARAAAAFRRGRARRRRDRRPLPARHRARISRRLAKHVPRRRATSRACCMSCWRPARG